MGANEKEAGGVRMQGKRGRVRAGEQPAGDRAKVRDVGTRQNGAELRKWGGQGHDSKQGALVAC